jgi:glycosyltransferase involved in cell wall biosynthesis
MPAQPHPAPKRVAVILSTFNQPLHLQRALAGYLRQLRPPDELLIADDGSGEETRAVVAAIAAQSSFPVTHLRHDHDGWRKPVIVNRAIAAATADYVILSDGDCIPRPDFVAAHLRLARPRTFLAGGDFRLPPEVTAAVSVADVLAGAVFQPSRLRELGLPPRRAKAIKLRAGPRLGALLDALNLSPARMGGSNASTWRDGLLAVNGLDERFRFPCKEDVEMGQRLRHLGFRGRHIRHQTLCLHLHHERGYWDYARTADNLRMLRETVSSRRTYAPEGLSRTSGPFTVIRYASAPS